MQTVGAARGDGFSSQHSPVKELRSKAVVMTTRIQGRVDANPGLANHSKVLDFNMPNDQRLLAKISHELRIPVTNLKLRLYLARMHPEQIDEQLRMMELITERMRALIEDLLDSARFELGVLHLCKQPVDLRELVATVIDQQRPDAEQKSITLSGEVLAGPVCASVDLSRMMQVLTNLVVNAINYTPAGGHVTVTCASPDGQPVIRVIDTGVGIPAELVHKVFEPFFRVDDGTTKGSGLGLTIVKEIVEAHGGKIVVESQPGLGSVFSVYLA
jgi:two-component system, OmpR family, phosphate regulon sensor histidine kinase PhoR